LGDCARRQRPRLFSCDDALKRGANLTKAWTLCGLLDQQGIDDVSELASMDENRRGVVENRTERRQGSGPFERRMTVEGSVERRAQGPEIGGQRRAFSACPLRGHVRWRSHDQSSSRDRGIALDSRYAKVGQNRSSSCEQHDVGGFDIAMKHADRGGCFQGIQDVQTYLSRATSG
jgi:hypothetical protein